MFLKHAQIAPARVSDLLSAAEKAARAIPPAFPLSATVAVNPFLGQTGEDLATAQARLARVSGTRILRPRADYVAEVASGRITDDDLAAALIAQPSGMKPALAHQATMNCPVLPHPATQCTTTASRA